MDWKDLDYWKSGEWQVVAEKLADLRKARVGYNPLRKDLFKIMDEVPFDAVSVAIMGQDPYPTAMQKYSTGIAFDIPDGMSPFPATLHNFLKEYERDLGYPMPAFGSLEKWVDQGVFLWNVIPSVEWGKPQSHNWPEYMYLTKEIVEKLSEKGIVFVFVGSKARDYVKYVDLENSGVIEVAHPSPRADKAKSPFAGSRIFSRCNQWLAENGREIIDWRL